MIRFRPLAIAGALLLTLAVPNPAGAQSAADTAAILSTVQRLFDAMLARDSAALDSVVSRGGVFTVVVVEGDSVTRFAHQALSGFISSIGQPGPDLRERMWQPRVFIDGPFAAVWTPYDFHIGERFNHCGTDLFTLAKIDDAWRITGGSYTIRQQDCAPSPLDEP